MKKVLATMAAVICLSTPAFAETYACTASDNSEIRDGKLRFFDKRLGEGQIWLFDDELKNSYNLIHEDGVVWSGWKHTDYNYIVSTFNKNTSVYTKVTNTHSKNHIITVVNNCKKFGN